MLDLLVLADHVNNCHKNTIKPKIAVILNTPIKIFRFLFSSYVISDQGFCFFPIAIPMDIPIAIPIAMPIGMPITKSLILYTYHKQRKVEYLRIIVRNLYKIAFLRRFISAELLKQLSPFANFSPVGYSFFLIFLP